MGPPLPKNCAILQRRDDELPALAFGTPVALPDTENIGGRHATARFSEEHECGNGEARIVLTQLLPNILPLMMVQVSLTLGYAILNAAGLSFIGLGVRPPTAEWGIMVADGASFIVSGEWWVAFFPGLVLMAAVFCFNLMGDGLRDMVDPQRRT
jgi:ABC-type microcin C transport system permease subunit YejE